VGAGGGWGAADHAIPLGECARRRHACPSSQATIQDPGSNLLIEPLPKGRLRGGICHRELERFRRPHIAMVHEIQMNWTFWLVHIKANFGSSERQRQRGGSMPLRSVMRTIGTAVTLMAAPLLPVGRNPSPRQTGDATGVRDRNVRVMLDLFRAIEERDPNHRNVERELSFYQPDVEFHWPAALPYGGTFRGLAGGRGT